MDIAIDTNKFLDYDTDIRPYISVSDETILSIVPGDMRDKYPGSIYIVAEEGGEFFMLVNTGTLIKWSGHFRTLIPYYIGYDIKNQSIDLGFLKAFNISIGYTTPDGIMFTKSFHE